MKPIMMLIATASIVISSSYDASAQIAAGKKLLSVGFEAGLPLGDFKEFFDVGLGGSVQYDHPVAPKMAVTLNAGYSNWTGKSFDVPILDENNNPVYDPETGTIMVEQTAFSDSQLIPVKLGLKYYFMDNFYGQAQAGVAIPIETGGSTAFVYAPGVGYSFPVSDNSFLDLSARWEGMSANSTNNSFIGLRLAYAFGLEGGASKSEMHGHERGRVR